MAQEPSGTGGQQPTEYDYGQSWQQGQVPAADSWDTGTGGAADGYDPQTYGAGQDGWGAAAQQQDPYAAQQQYAEPGYGQDPSYGGYGAQSYAQGYGGQGYDTSGYDGTGVYQATGQEQGQPDTYADPASTYSGDVQGYQDGQYQSGTQQSGTQQYVDYSQHPAADGDATQQWQAAAYGDQAPAAEPGEAGAAPGEEPIGQTGDAPSGQTGDAPRGPATALAARIRAAVTGGPGGLDRRAVLIRAAVGTTVLAVLVVVGIQLVGGGSDGAPAPTESAGHSSAAFAINHTKAWSAPPAAAAGGGDNLVGSWLLAKAVVRGDGTGVHAYDVASGKQLWTLQPPKSGAVPCGMSPTAGGVGAVLFTPKAGSKSCTLLSAVDTATGKQKWTKTLSSTHGAYAAHVMVNSTRVVAVGDSKAVGYDSATGKQKWESAGRGKFCTLTGSGSGNTVLLYSSCADSKPKDQVVALDAGSGRLSWWRGLTSPRTVSVLSAEPAVILTTGDKETDDTIRYWDAKGNAGPAIPVTQGDARLDVDQGALDAAPNVFFNGTTMATALVPAEGSSPANVSLTALNLATGKPVWKVTAHEKGKIAPVGIDGGSLVAATEERTDQPAHLSRFTLTDGAETAGGGFPKNTGSLLTSGRLLTTDTLIAAVPVFTSAYSTTVFQVQG